MNEPTMDTVTQRLDRLEQEIRWWRSRHGVLVLLAVVSSLTVACATVDPRIKAYNRELAQLKAHWTDFAKKCVRELGAYWPKCAVPGLQRTKEAYLTLRSKYGLQGDDSVHQRNLAWYAYQSAVLKRSAKRARPDEEYRKLAAVLDQALKPPIDDFWWALHAFRVAVWARVDNNEITQAESDALIADFQFRVAAERRKLRALEVQARAAKVGSAAAVISASQAYWANFWRMQQQSQQQLQLKLKTPINCTTSYFGTRAQTNCY